MISPGAGESALHALRAGVRSVRVLGRIEPTGILLHPTVGVLIDTLERNNEENNFIRDPFSATGPRSLRGIRVVETEVVPEGEALIGDFRKAILFDRQQFNVAVGTAMDDFLKNIVRLLGEIRAGFTVVRPTAFAIVSTVAGS